MKNPTTPSLYRYPRRGGGNFGYQVTGITEGFFGVWNFRFRGCLGSEILASILVFNSNVLCFVGNFYGSEIRLGICLVLNFGPGIFLGFWVFWALIGSPRDIFRVWFLPPFDHPCHLKSVVPPPLPPRLGQSAKFTQDFRSHAKR